MHPIIQKTFGGLSVQYLIRNFIFGAGMSIFLIIVMANSTHGIPVSLILLSIVNALLYPYARFVYESIVNYIVGNNTFFVNAILMIFVKLMTMMMCWGFSIFIAPFGLIYLYFYHSKTAD